MIKIKAVQENPKVGDIKGNTALIEKYLASADKEKIDLLIFSEMFLSGYPPEDLVMRDDFLDEITKSIVHLTNLTKKTSLVFGAPIKNRLFYSLEETQQRVFSQRKIRSYFLIHSMIIIPLLFKF